MKRRDFIKVIAGFAAASPFATRAQSERVRRIGVLSALAADDPEAQAQFAVLWQELRQLGWAIGRNLQIDYRWGAGDTERIRCQRNRAQHRSIRACERRHHRNGQRIQHS
jgi:putative ABC transport system substrate-binding protein